MSSPQEDWLAITNSLMHLQQQLSMVGPDSPYSSRASEYQKTIQAMIIEAWGMGGPITKKLRKEALKSRKAKYSGSIDFVSIVDVSIQLFDVNSNRMAVGNSLFGLSDFFACVYSALIQHGCWQDNLLLFHEKLFEQMKRIHDQYPGLSISYQAIDKAIKKWQQFVMDSKPYDRYYIYSISESQVCEELRNRFRSLRNLYDHVVELLRENGVIPADVEKSGELVD